MEIFKESVTQKEKFRVSANKLLNSCYIVKKKEDTKNNYIFILQNRDFFIEYFDLLGYKIVINEAQGVIALTNNTGTGRLRLKKIESIILLILRLLYIEKRKGLSLNEDIVILAEEIHEKYNMLKIQDKPNIDRTSFRESIKLFRRYNIVTNIDNDVLVPDARIKIYPSVLFAVTNENITKLYDDINDKLDRYITGGEVDDDEETMQD